MHSLNRPIPEILSDLIANLTALIRKEGQLARTEISEKVSRALTGLALIVGGSVLLIPALVILLQAAMAALVQNGTSPAVASLIVGTAALLLGLVLAFLGWSWIRPASLVPDRTIDRLQRDAEVARHAAGAVSPKAPLSRTIEQETRHGYDPKRAA
jgi:hypothetical protein